MSNVNVLNYPFMYFIAKNGDIIIPIEILLNYFENAKTFHFKSKYVNFNVPHADRVK